MQLSKIYTFTLLLSVYLFIAFSDGPAGGIGNNGVRMQDRTGSPFAVSSGPTCATCHKNGVFTPSLEVSLLDGGNPVTSYEPNKTYQLRYTLSTITGSPSAFGVQSVILADADNSNVGAFGAPPTGTRVAPISTRSYFEHSTPSTSPTFEVDWTAPEAGTGALTIYAAGVVSNLDNDNDNDNAAAETLSINELINAVKPASWSVETLVFPNPTDEVLNLVVNSSQEQSATLTITDVSGNVLEKEKIRLVAGEITYRISVQKYPAGMYWLMLKNDKGAILTKKIIKN